ncbi:MAG: beta-N-acetylhexosaminidase [Acidobacteriota bacterium]|nr:beta-N-acetylhexosaminidase [Blastocatellia bacterium]MDW8411797.1 beta-N-acetylhexosaminidase [Acidobacteriota bacterium]
MTSLSLEHKLGQMLFIGIPGTTVDTETQKLLKSVQPGGIILFARNIEEPQQVAELNAEIRRQLKVPPLISIDQEGGPVDRLKKICPPMAAAHKLRLADDARLANEQGAITAELLRLLGFNMNFAPVLDLAVHDDADNALRHRCFGARPAKIIRLAGAYLEGLQNGSVIGCGKHFPGLGDSVVDSHKELPVVDRSEEQLMAEDLQVYVDLSAKLNSQLQVVMVAHAFYRAFEGANVRTRVPASLSPRIVTDLLRSRLDFHGMAIADDLEMGAITTQMSVGDAAVACVEAGEDMVLICNTPAKVYEAAEALIRAAYDGRITPRRIEASINRIARIKSMACSPLTYEVAHFQRLCDRIADFNYRLDAYLSRL